MEIFNARTIFAKLKIPVFNPKYGDKNTSTTLITNMCEIYKLYERFPRNLSVLESLVTKNKNGMNKAIAKKNILAFK